MLQLDLDLADEVSQFAVSPDGLTVAYVSKGQLAIRRLDQAKITPLAGTEGARAPFFSPDGQWVAFFDGLKLQKIAVGGGAPVALCDAALGSASWGEDGNIVAALSSNGGLSKVSALGGMPQPLTDLKGEAQSVQSHRWPQVLPGGKGVLFTSYVGGEQGSLRVMPLGGRAKTLVENSVYGRYLAGGYLIYYQGGALFAASMDLNRLVVRGPALPLVNGVAYDNARGAAFDASAETLVYHTGPGGNKRVVSWLDSYNRADPILVKPADYLCPRLSPDGNRLVVAVSQPGQSNLSIYDLTRETMTPLTFGSSRNTFPVWTPDGEFLAFRSGTTLAWTRADGSGKVERQADRYTRAPWSFSPDGKWLAFWDPTDGRLWAAPVDRTAGAMHLGEPPLPLLPRAGAGKAAPAVSPDGRWLAYHSSELSRYEVYVIPFSPGGRTRGGQWQVSNAGGQAPMWSHNGRDLFYRSLDRRVMAVAYRAKGDSFVWEKPRVWAEKQLADLNTSQTFDVAPDGKRVVALFDSEETKPETHLRVLLNVTDELRRRTAAK